MRARPPGSPLSALPTGRWATRMTVISLRKLSRLVDYMRGLAGRRFQGVNWPPAYRKCGLPCAGLVVADQLGVQT